MAKPLPPFLTPFEFIRVVTNALNLTKQSKYLDDRAHNLTADYRDIKQSIVQFIQEPLEGYLDKERATVIGGCFSYVFAEYLGLVRNTDLDGVTRDGNCQLLAKYFLPKTILRCVALVADQMPGPNPTLLFGANSSAVATVLTWAEGNLPGWNRYYSGLNGDENKNKRDRINRWKSGSELPTLAYIKGIQSWSNGPWPELLDWNHLKFWLLVARAIDWARQSDTGQTLVAEVRLQLWGANPTKSYPEAAKEVQILASTKLKPTFPLVAKLQNELKRTKRNGNIDSDELGIAIEKLRGLLAEIDSESTTTYWVDWHEARWYVFSGDLKAANELYKKAFDGCLYRSGQNLELILQEARSVAASLNSPDKNFLKKISNMSVLFGLVKPFSKKSIADRSNKSSDFFEDWEISLWKADLEVIFPAEGRFYLHDSVDVVDQTGPLIFSDIENIKPDFRYPDRIIKIGDTWKKKFPQIVFFCMQENAEVVQKLLGKGATVNCESSSGDTPIQIALECLNVFDIPLKSLDRKMWDIISNCDNASEKINSRTHKRKLLPLVIAVKSGLPDVVSKVLELGADVSCRGETDEQTALNVCIKLIGAIKHPDEFLKTQSEMGLTPDVLESIRRHTNGMVSELNSKQHYSDLYDTEFYQNFRKKTLDTLRTRMLQNYRIEDLQEIASMLLKAGSDPNAEHESPLRGYTPLMLATQLDEDSMVEKMLICGGKPDKTYYDQKAKDQLDCWDIAYYHRSKKVLHLLNGIRHHFKKPEVRLEDV